MIEDNRIEMKRVEYPIEETVARIESMPWPRRGKDIMVQALRLGKMPENLPGDDKREWSDDPSVDMLRDLD